MTADPRFGRATALEDIDRIYQKQVANRAAIGATTARERIAKIRRIRDAMFARRDEIRDALASDYGKHAAEVDLSEIYPVVSEAKHAMRHLRHWMAPHRVSTPLVLMGSRSRILYQPKGVVLIISPWNFPVNLTFGPLVSAIAAGNCVILKPSEMTPATSDCMRRIVSDLFDESEVAVIEGDAAVAEALLRKRFDHIFFTGSPAVGKIVMRAAAEHLTSVTLELGGKSPAIVDRTANIDEAAKKIAWGKFLNQGQVCIAPDYILVDDSIRAKFVERLRSAIVHPVGPLVHHGHAQRLKRLFDGAVERGAKVVHGGGIDGRVMQPTILEEVDLEAAVMQEEIFGPLLPVIPYTDLGDALRMIEDRERPLVIYIFSRSRKVINRILSDTRAGGTAINDTQVHFFQNYLPFGGVGQSGIGKAHGFFGFQSFSNARGVLEQPTRFSGTQLLYPPYTKLKRKLIDLTVKYI